jgi:7-cyano-7-deazaguanine reductase
MSQSWSSSGQAGAETTKDPYAVGMSSHEGPSTEVATTSLTILGNTVREAVDHVEVFPAPANVDLVRFTTDELSSMCPVTRQPDLSHVVIEYQPLEWCVESKSLKLYLWNFRDRAVFAEALAAEIAGEIMETAKPRKVIVTLTQRPRGGIEVQTVASLGS